MSTHWRQLIKSISLVVCFTLAFVSCKDKTIESPLHKLVLCGQDKGKIVRAYLVTISDSQIVALEQVVDLPGDDLVQGDPCPHWLDNNIAWLYGNTLNNYERDVYLLNLADGQITPWFRLDGNARISDITLGLNSPQALIISNQNDNSCSHQNSLEGWWSCLNAQGDLYIVDSQGKLLRLTEDQSPLCEARFSPDNSNVVFRQSAGCTGHYPEESSSIFFVDIETRHIRSFVDNQGLTPLWTPNGKTVAFFGWDLPTTGVLTRPLYIFDVEKELSFLVDNDPNIGLLQWSPNSRYLAWTTYAIDKSPNAAQYFQVAIFDVERQVTEVFPEQSGVDFQWSPNGTDLAIRTASGFSFVTIDSTEIYSLPVKAKTIYHWSFDGEFIVYVDQSEPNQVFLVSRSYSQIINLTNELALESVNWEQAHWLDK